MSTEHADILPKSKSVFDGIPVKETEEYQKIFRNKEEKFLSHPNAYPKQGNCPKCGNPIYAPPSVREDVECDVFRTCHCFDEPKDE